MNIIRKGLGNSNRFVNAIIHASIAGKSGEFGESSAIHQTKTIQLVLTISSPLADLLIHQTFFRQRLEKSQFAKLSSSLVYGVARPLFLLLYSDFPSKYKRRKSGLATRD